MVSRYVPNLRLSAPLYIIMHFLPGISLLTLRCFVAEVRWLFPESRQKKREIGKQRNTDPWLTFKKAIHDGTLKHIPHKTCKHKNNLPWITPSIKRLIRQTDRTNIKRKRARERNAVGASRLLDQKLRELKRKIQRESRNSIGSMSSLSSHRWKKAQTTSPE